MKIELNGGYKLSEQTPNHLMITGDFYVKDIPEVTTEDLSKYEVKHVRGTTYEVYDIQGEKPYHMGNISWIRDKYRFTKRQMNMVFNAEVNKEIKAMCIEITNGS